MAEKATIERSAASVTGLIPMAHVADVRRSVEFFKLLGMELHGSLRNDDGVLQWAHLSCEQADLMLTRRDGGVVPAKKPVMFYLYSPDLVFLREHLLAKELTVSPITYPNYMPKGEFQVEDPDGYTLLIGQVE